MRSYRRMFKPQQKVQPENKIQAWWRRILAVRAAKKPLRKIFEGDVTGLTGLRCLVLIGVDDDVLGIWARAMIRLGPEAIPSRGFGEHGTSWLVLLRKTALLLLLSLANVPESPNASVYLDILTVLLSNELAVAASGAQGSAFCQAITAYLMKQQLYQLLGQSISKISIENSTSLPPFLALCALPLSTYPENSPQFNKIYVHIVTRVFILPFLPNRLPLDIPSPLISCIFLTNSDKLTPLLDSISDNLSAFSSPHLAANVFMFVSPHYKMLSTSAFASYLQLSVMLYNRFSAYTLVSSSLLDSNHVSGFQTNPVDHDLDCSDDDYGDSRLSGGRRYLSTLKVNDETLKWIEKIASPHHITDLINFTQSQAILLPHLVAYLFTVTAMWPSSQKEIQNIFLASSRGKLVRDLYRETVRQSPLGQEEGSMIVFDPASAIFWPPVIFLADIYSQALHTMDDEEFFGEASGSPGCNPLSLEEVASFGVQLLNIVFTLDWRYSDYVDMAEEGMVVMHISGNVRCTWKVLGAKLLRCLSRIYARDSRRPFASSGHWLLRSQFNMNTFIDAAVDQEQRSSRTHSEMPLDITDHQWSFMEPRLVMLKNIPFAIPFEARVSIFQHLIINDKLLHGSTERNALGHDQRLRVKIRRGEVAQDGLERLSEVDLKAPLEIVMTDQFEHEEVFRDGVGHFKEFFTSFCQQMLETYSGLWLKNQRGELSPTSHGFEVEVYISNWYWLVGRMVGKAMYEGILVDTPFSTLFLSKLLERRSYFDDLSLIDPDLYCSLLSIKHATENTEELSLNFTITIDGNGVTESVDLIPNGRDIAVTWENRLRYINLAARRRLDTQLQRQSEAFLDGLSHLIEPKWLKMFNPQELQILIGGANVPIDLDDLRRHTTYGGIYHNTHETIIAFWQVVNSFYPWQNHCLLRFVTNCSRPHVLGFKELVPNFTIRDGGSDKDRLPTSSTSVNLLNLPTYKSDGKLREMLLEAITT